MICFLNQYQSYIFLGILFLSYHLARGQNLVVNPSFEDFTHCPETFSSFQEDVLFWTNPTFGSTDYFNTCSSKMNADRNFNGVQPSFHGEAYAGIYAYGPKDYREYIPGELSEKLKKDKTYIVSAKISLAEKSEYAVAY